MIGAAAYLFAALLPLPGAGFGPGGRIEVITGSTVSETFPALRNGRPGQVELRRLQFRAGGDVPDTREALRFRDPAKAASTRELLLFRDPQTGSFVFMARLLQQRFLGISAEPGDLLPNTAISLEKGVLRGFFFLGYSLLIAESAGRAASMDAAQKQALTAFSHSTQHSLYNWWVQDGRWIRLLERLPAAITSHVRERLPPATRLRDLSRSGACWGVAIEGPDAGLTRFMISDSYDLSTAEGCAAPSLPVPHVILPPGEVTRQMPALRDNQPAALEAQSMVARVTFPDAQTGRLLVRMIRDPRTRLFWWDASLIYPSETEAGSEQMRERFPKQNSVFVTRERISVFSDGAVRESRRRFPDWQAAKAHVVAALEQTRGAYQENMQALPFHALDVGVPRDFFTPCFYAMMTLPELAGVERIGKLWKLRYTGMNGNSAVVTLNDNYERTDVQLTGSNNCESTPTWGPAPSVPSGGYSKVRR